MIDNDKWPKWLTKFKVYVGKRLFSYLEKPKPETDIALMQTLVAANGDETAESRAYKKIIRERVKKWKNRKDKLHQYLMNACSDNPSAFSLAQQHEDDDPSVLFDALEKRFLDQSQAALHHHISIFNQLSCGASESRTEFIERLVSYKLTLKNYGYEISDDVQMERLLNGLKGREKFDNDARQLQLVENKTWEYITNRLRGWDREEEVVNKNKASANFASQNSVNVNSANSAFCYRCKKTGHKRFDCPLNKNSQKWKSNGNQWRNFNNNGNNEPPRGGGGKGGKGGKGGRGGRGSGGRGGGGGGKLTCSLCNKQGHHANQCNHAEAFRKHLENNKRKPDRQATPDDESSISTSSS